MRRQDLEQGDGVAADGGALRFLDFMLSGSAVGANRESSDDFPRPYAGYVAGAARVRDNSRELHFEFPGVEFGRLSRRELDWCVERRFIRSWAAARAACERNGPEREQQDELTADHSLIL